MAHAAWNERQLDRPVINTQLHNALDLDLTALRALLERGAAATFSPVTFNEVAALASRLIARRAPSFRAQYGFKLMRKANIALCRLHECNVTPALLELLATLPAYRLKAGAPLELPTRDNFDYVLVRVRSLAALLARLTRCAREASELFLFYIHRRYFLETAVVHVAVLSEVWQRAQQLCAATVQFYDELQPFARHFGDQQTWLRSLCGAADAELPPRLGTWLGDEWREECRRAKQGARLAALPTSSTASTDGGGAIAAFDFGNSGADQDCVVEMIPSSVEAPDKAAKAVVKKPPPKVQIAKIEPTVFSATPASSMMLSAANDIGVAIARKPPSGGANSAAKTLRLEQLVSTDDVQAFMKAERSRLALGADRWKELQRKVNHILVTTQGRNTVRAFRKYWSQAVLNKVVR